MPPTVAIASRRFHRLDRRISSVDRNATMATGITGAPMSTSTSRRKKPGLWPMRMPYRRPAGRRNSALPAISLSHTSVSLAASSVRGLTGREAIKALSRVKYNELRIKKNARIRVLTIAPITARSSSRSAMFISIRAESTAFSKKIRNPAR